MSDLNDADLNETDLNDTDLNDDEVLALAKAAGIAIPADLLPEVGASLNGLLAALDAIPAPDVATIEPLPIIVSDTARRQEVA